MTNGDAFSTFWRKLPRPIAGDTPWIIWYVIWLHGLWGIALLVQASSPETVTVAMFTNTLGKDLTGILFVGASLFAATSHWLPSGLVRVVVLLPQQALLTAIAMRLILLWPVVQNQNVAFFGFVTVILLGILHNMAILDMHGVFRWINTRSLSPR